MAAKKLMVTRGLSAWKTIRLGTHNTTQSLRVAVEAGGYSLHGCADECLGRIAPASTEICVDLVRVPSRDIPVIVPTYNPPISRIRIYAESRGLTLCPAEVGPQLCLQYDNQPSGERLWIAMNPIVLPPIYGSNMVFGVDCNAFGNGGRRLCAHCVYPVDVWDDDYQLVFVRPRKATS